MSVWLMQEPIKSLTQSYMRTKAMNYRSFRDTMDLHTINLLPEAERNAVMRDASFHASMRLTKVESRAASHRQRCPGISAAVCSQADRRAVHVGAAARSRRGSTEVART